MSAKTPAKGQTKKHALSASAKHAAHVKHEAHLAHLTHLKAIGKAPKVTVKAAPAKPAKPAKAKARSFAIGDLLPVCAFEAVAMSLRLAGQRVSDDEVAELWWLGGQREATIPEALAAFGAANVPHPSPGRGEGSAESNRLGVWKGPLTSRAVRRLERLDQAPVNLPVILGIDVPGPHAVLATADGWWSWGELHDPWPCRVEEAWAVSWS